MESPAVVVMAAGLGSRYGGLKQLEPVTEAGELMLDFSLYDARRAGFKEAVFVIKREMEDDMRRLVDAGAGRHMGVSYAYQDMGDVPGGLSVPGGRDKPLGTGHAIWCARHAVGGPFAVVNADDYYGMGTFKAVRVFLDTVGPGDARYALVAYRLGNTLSESGAVTRGACEVGEDGYVKGVRECRGVERRGGGIAFRAETGAMEALMPDNPVSMNFWGLTPAIFGQLEGLFGQFSENALKQDPMGAEFLLPEAIDALVKRGAATVRALPCDAKWHGVTYREDKKGVAAALQGLKHAGAYPHALWG
jgi:NDP-sugar pyrophosphorylase family protein